MQLLDFPAELFSQVVHQLVSVAGVAQAWPLRSVCRTFAADITHDVLANQPKEVLIPFSARGVMKRNLPGYLYNRIQVPFDVDTMVPKRIEAMASYLCTELNIDGSAARDKVLIDLCKFLANNFYPYDEVSILEALWGANIPEHLPPSPKQRMGFFQGNLSIYDKLSAAAAVDSQDLVRRLLPRITDPMANSITNGPLIDAIKTQNLAPVKTVMEYLSSLNLKQSHNRQAKIDWLTFANSHFRLGTAMSISIEHCDDQGEITHALAQFYQEQLSIPNPAEYTSWLTKSCQFRRLDAMDSIAKLRRSKSWHSGPKSVVLKAAGCIVRGYGNASQTIFACLQSKDTSTLQNASAAVTATGTYGTWAFLPVTDHVLVQSLPSNQLLEKRVNGRNLLVGNNANEGPAFTPQTIVTESALLSWLEGLLPEFSTNDLAKVLIYYPIDNTANTTKFATAGDSGPSALDTSTLATGQQQRANNIYAELTFVCPSYWMAEAYSGQDRTSYRYQFSVIPALHGYDVEAYFGPLGRSPYVSADFQRAFMKIWGNFITTSNPSISNQFAAGSSSNATATTNAASSWPSYSISTPYQLDLNQTGGTLASMASTIPFQYLTGPTLRNNITLANAYTWEAGRGARCDFWRSLAPIVPA